MKTVIEPGHAPVKLWTDGVPVEDQALIQLKNVSAMPFIHKWVAAMPDVHWGIGATVGSVIATKRAIIPAAVGVDIGCGMTAVKTELTAADLPDSMALTRSLIEKKVPHGRTDNGGPNDRGAWGEPTKEVAIEWAYLWEDWKTVTQRHPKLERGSTINQLGTLGTGNHFIEVCLDESDNVWLMLHSGSRGPGNRIGSYFIEQAKKEAERWFIKLPDKDLAYLPEDTVLFDDYVMAVGWAQRYAKVNRRVMLNAALSGLSEALGRDVQLVEEVISCHHNYVERENHYGENVWVTRKGAVRARENDLGIIPGSMGVRSYIVRGRGNPESFHSCSHGAGRKMSRNKAREIFTLSDHELATAGVECRKDAGVLDETPGAYKDIDAVMAAQADLVEVVHTLKQIVCVKG